MSTRTDDVNTAEVARFRTLEILANLNSDLFEALKALKHSTLTCWCPYSLGERFHRTHTEACKFAQLVYVKAGGK